MTRRRRSAGSRTAGGRRRDRPTLKRRANARAKPKPAAGRPARPSAAGPEGPTLKSQAQLEIRLGRGARPLTAVEEAARLASARMERRIGRLLWRRTKLKFS
jgi:hypothetical protein